jgi:hypothetical protein
MFATSMVAVLTSGCERGAMGAPSASASSTWPPVVAQQDTLRSRLHRTAKKPQQLIYVADGSTIWIFPERPNAYPIGEIDNGVNTAYGLCIDAHGTLYVANDGNNTVTAYPAGSASPSAIYSQDLSRPLYPVVDANGDLFVGNANNGTVVEYQAGSTSAYAVLQTPGSEADGMDFDAQGNLYVAYRGSNGDSIEKFAPGSSKGESLGMELDQPQGLAVTRNGDILVGETGRAAVIDLYTPGKITPKLEFSVPGFPVELALTQRQNALFVSTLGGGVYVTAHLLHDPNFVQEVDGGSSAQGVAISNGQYF